MVNVEFEIFENKNEVDVVETRSEPLASMVVGDDDEGFDDVTAGSAGVFSDSFGRLSISS